MKRSHNAPAAACTRYVGHVNSETLPPDWRRVSDAEPAALTDVWVSVRLAGMTVGQTYLAWRQDADPSAWFITGTEQRLPGEIYAWAPCGEAAPLPPSSSAQRSHLTQEISHDL